MNPYCQGYYGDPGTCPQTDRAPRLGMSIAALSRQVTNTCMCHINADEPSVLDYNTEYKSAGQVISLYAADEYRSSDHDPVIVDLELGLAGDDTTLPEVHLGPADGPPGRGVIVLPSLSSGVQHGRPSEP